MASTTINASADAHCTETSPRTHSVTKSIPAAAAPVPWAQNNAQLVAELLRRKRLPQRIIDLFTLPCNAERFRFSFLQSGWADIYTLETCQPFDALPAALQWPRLTTVDVWPQVSDPKHGNLFLATRKGSNGYVELVQYHGPEFEQTSPHAWTSAETGCAISGDDLERLLGVSPVREDRRWRDRKGNLLRPEYIAPRVAADEDSDLCDFLPATHSNEPGAYFTAYRKAANTGPFTKRQSLVFAKAQEPKHGDTVFALVSRKARRETWLQRTLFAAASRSNFAYDALTRWGYTFFQPETRSWVLRRYVQLDNVPAGMNADMLVELGAGGCMFRLDPLAGEGESLVGSELFDIELRGVAIDALIWGRTDDSVMI